MLYNYGGEITLQPYDSCRLMCLNLFSFVDNPFTDEAKINYKKLYEIAYEQQRLMDDLVDLELETIEKIIKKIKSDNEPENVKRTELHLWENIYATGKAGRRTGSGVTALADMLAALGFKYDSKEALEITDKVMKTKMRAEIDCTIDLSILRGSFKGWNNNKEFRIYVPDVHHKNPNTYIDFKNIRWVGQNNFYQFLIDFLPKYKIKRLFKHGRRNISFSTIAPTGSVSILCQTSSGCEPVFMPFYMRRKKINPNDKGNRIDFTDQNGDIWQEYPVLHPKFKNWMQIKNNWNPNEPEYITSLTKDELQKQFEKSPWHKSTANDINWEYRLKMQEVLQKYVSHSISSTLNLPENTSIDTVSQIYIKASQMGLKGVTVYRDGSRSGVLVSKKEEKKDNFFTVDAFKRQNPTTAQSYITSVNGEKYTVIVGCINNNPYEVFAMKGSFFNRQDGEIHKISSGNYSFVTNKNNYEEIQFNMNDVQEDTCKLISGMLRHRMSAKYIVDILTKGSGEITGFNKAIARILKKYIKNGEKIDKKCSECGSASLIYQEGCLICNNCGYSKC